MKTIEQLATEVMCPKTGKATTLYERNMIKFLSDFGHRVMAECQNTNVDITSRDFKQEFKR